MTDDEKAAWAEIEFLQSVDDLVNYGPSLNVRICGLPITERGVLIVAAQIDTGAAGSCISLKLAGELGLPIIGTGEIHQPGLDPIPAPYFKARIAIRSGVGWYNLDLVLAGLAILDPPHNVLIGRDILAHGRISVDFLTGVTIWRIKAN